MLLDPVHIDLDPSLLMFRQHRFAAQLAISVTFDEFLLVFESEMTPCSWFLVVSPYTRSTCLSCRLWSVCG